jgi:hypothetical protein
LVKIRTLISPLPQEDAFIGTIFDLNKWESAAPQPPTDGKVIKINKDGSKVKGSNWEPWFTFLHVPSQLSLSTSLYINTYTNTFFECRSSWNQKKMVHLHCAAKGTHCCQPWSWRRPLTHTFLKVAPSTLGLPSSQAKKLLYSSVQHSTVHGCLQKLSWGHRGKHYPWWGAELLDKYIFGVLGMCSIQIQRLVKMWPAVFFSVFCAWTFGLMGYKQPRNPKGWDKCIT